MNLQKVVLRAAMPLALSAAMAFPAFAQQSGSDANNSSSADSSASSKISAKDQQFLKKLAMGNEAEIELGQLAQDKASNQAVKDFGKRMVDDHTKAKDQMQQLASKENIDLPSKPAPKEAAEKARLEKLSGAQFDRAYMRHMVMDHRKDVNEVKNENVMTKNQDVKQLTSQLLPTLQDHLQNAEQVNSQVNGSALKTGSKAGNAMAESTPKK
jgi:putative membrane protein